MSACVARPVTRGHVLRVRRAMHGKGSLSHVAGMSYVGIGVVLDGVLHQVHGGFNGSYW
jgi:hypothetical protein